MTLILTIIYITIGVLISSTFIRWEAPAKLEHFDYWFAGAMLIMGSIFWIALIIPAIGWAVLSFPWRKG